LLSGGASWTGTGGYDGEGSIKFDGTSGEVLVSDSANQVVPASGAPFSFALWFEPNITGSGKAALVSAGISGSTGFQFGVDSTVSPPNLFFSISGSGGTEVETPIAPGGWTQAAVSYDGTNASLYVNGIEQVSGTGLMLSDTSTITLAQGYAGTQPFAGAMENLTFYQADLQQADVTSLCNLSTTSTGPDSSGLPNYWKYQYFGTLSVDPTATVAWSNGQITNLQAYQLGLNPIDFYNAQTPILAIVSGSGQIGSPGGFAPAPLVVSVSDTSGNPLTSAPVTFTVVSGSGQVKQSYMSSPANSLTVFANGAGQAEVYFQLSSGSSTTSEITATAGPASSPAEVIFTESTDNGCGTYGSPFAPSNVAAVLNPDGSADISWQNNTDDPSDIPVKIKQRDGSWATVTTVPAGTTYVHIPAQ
jgi:hypothetical protein